MGKVVFLSSHNWYPMRSQFSPTLGDTKVHFLTCLAYCFPIWYVSFLCQHLGRCPVRTEDIIKAKERYGGESHVPVEEVEVWDHFWIQKRGGSP